MNVLTVSWFSAGISSAVATWLMRDKIDRIIYIDIDDQHRDTLRFVADCERWFEKKIEILKSPYGCVRNACRAGGTAYINGPTGANCTRWLKKRVRNEWEADNTWFCNLRYVWGMDFAEQTRAENLSLSMPDFEHVFPLIENGITKEEAHGIFAKSGIKRPAMYELGYRNNNCIGCVKGGKGYWNKIRKDFPEVFADRARLEREIGGSCINGVYLDELDPKAGRKQGPVVEECGIICEVLNETR